MKKVLLSFAVVSILAACAGEPASQEGGETPADSNAVVVEDTTANTAVVAEDTTTVVEDTTKMVADTTAPVEGDTTTVAE